MPGVSGRHHLQSDSQTDHIQEPKVDDAVNDGGGVLASEIPEHVCLPRSHFGVLVTAVSKYQLKPSDEISGDSKQVLG